MTNEEMQQIIEFMIQRQETFASNMDRLEANQERMQAGQERMQASQEQMQAHLETLQIQVSGLATIIGEIGAAQIRTQNDLSQLSKIVTLLVERNGGDGKQQQ